MCWKDLETLLGDWSTTWSLKWFGILYLKSKQTHPPYNTMLTAEHICLTWCHFKYPTTLFTKGHNGQSNYLNLFVFHLCVSVYDKVNREETSNTKEPDAIPAGQLRLYGLASLLSLLTTIVKCTLNRRTCIPWLIQTSAPALIPTKVSPESLCCQIDSIILLRKLLQRHTYTPFYNWHPKQSAAERLIRFPAVDNMLRRSRQTAMEAFLWGMGELLTAVVYVRGDMHSRMTVGGEAVFEWRVFFKFRSDPVFPSLCFIGFKLLEKQQ